MSFDDYGNPVIYVIDKEGNTRGYLATTSIGPMLTLTDKKGGMNVVLKADDDGSSAIAL